MIRLPDDHIKRAKTPDPAITGPSSLPSNIEDGKGAEKISDGAGAEKISRPEPQFSPREDQQNAIKNVLKGFSEHDRGQLVLPCGSGKTLTSLWIKEALKNKDGTEVKKTLVLVPSISLIKQTKDEWNTHKKKDFDYLCVCSDDKVNELKDEESFDQESLAELRQDARDKVTTDANDIRRFLLNQTEKDSSVVFATYQSLPKIMEALKSSDFEFDIAFADEAHKTTGKLGQLFGLMHDDENLPAKRRLYMTATPKVHSGSDEHKGEYADMSNESIYGPEFHRMSFAEAIERGILTDYQIVAVAINKENFEKEMADKGIDAKQAQELLHNLALEKVMKNHKASHALTFHSTIRNAEDFKKNHKILCPDVASFSIKGKDNVQTRNRIMDEFKSNPFDQRAVISNARCLTEGVDVPSIDMVYFTDPKSSVVDIVQASGRAFRKNRAKPNKIGYVVVPVVVRDGETAKQALHMNKFADLVRVITSLADHDERLLAKITETNNQNSGNNDSEPLPALILEGFDEGININSDSFRDEIISSSREMLTGQKFKSFQELKEAIHDISPEPPANIGQFVQEELSLAGISRKELKIHAVNEGLLDKDAVLSSKKIREIYWVNKGIPQPYESFKEFQEEFLKEFKREPLNMGNAVQSFVKSNTNTRNLNQPDLFRNILALLKEEKGITERKLKTTTLRKFIYSGENSIVAQFKKSLLAAHPEKPKSLNDIANVVKEFKDHFPYESRLFSEFEEKYPLATTLTAYNQNDLFDSVWGIGDLKYEEVKKTILEEYPNPIEKYELEDFLIDRFNISLNTYASMFLKELRAVPKSFTLNDLSCAIWGEAVSGEDSLVSPSDLLASMKIAILQDFPERPAAQDLSQIFSEYMKGQESRILDHLARSYDFHYYNSNCYSTDLADFIWGSVNPKETIPELIQRIHEINPQLRSAFAGGAMEEFEKILDNTSISAKSLHKLKTLYSLSNVEQTGFLQELVFGDIEKLVSKLNRFKTNLIRANARSKPLFDDPESIFGMSMPDFYKEVLKPLSYGRQQQQLDEQEKREGYSPQNFNPYKMLRRVQNKAPAYFPAELNLDYRVRSIITKKYPDYPKTSKELEDILNDCFLEFDYLRTSDHRLYIEHHSCPNDDIGVKSVISKIWGVDISLDDAGTINATDNYRNRSKGIFKEVKKTPLEIEQDKLFADFRKDHPERPKDLGQYIKDHGLLLTWLKLIKEAMQKHIIKNSKIVRNDSIDEELATKIWS